MYASKLQHIFERKFCKGTKEHPYRTIRIYYRLSSINSTFVEILTFKILRHAYRKRKRKNRN